jgi:hypothetical protein
MEDLSEYTRDYFKKTDVEKKEIFDSIYRDVEFVIKYNNPDLEKVIIKLDQLLLQSSEKEEYEVCEMIRSIKDKLKEKYHV